MAEVVLVLTVLLAAAHSYLGERFILIRLFRRADLPRLFGGKEKPDPPMKMTWHGIVVVRIRDGRIAHWREYQYQSPLEWEQFVDDNRFCTGCNVSGPYATSHQEETLTRTATLAILTLAASAIVAAQEPAPVKTPPPPLGVRNVTALAGGGVATAGSGLQVEKYFKGDRLSVFAGVGYSYELEDEDKDDEDIVSASGGGVAAGLRVYTGGRIHRGFLEVAYSPLGYETAFEGFPQDQLRLMYGPSVQAGWQMTRPGGFTLVLSAGVGHARATDNVEGFADAAAFLGLGKTWRQK